MEFVPVQRGHTHHQGVEYDHHVTCIEKSSVEWLPVTGAVRPCDELTLCCASLTCNSRVCGKELVINRGISYNVNLKPKQILQ